MLIFLFKFINGSSFTKPSNANNFNNNGHACHNKDAEESILNG